MIQYIKADGEYSAVIVVMQDKKAHVIVKGGATLEEAKSNLLQELVKRSPAEDCLLDYDALKN